jgi:isopentenyl diphosphate isomerase/L-lactate dehydrogenase-like FMN-dependent dehydrogenase
MGGALSGASFRQNILALSQILLKTRLVHQVREPILESYLLGIKLALPLIIGPIGGIAFNLNSAMSETDYQEAVIIGSLKTGIMAGLPDGVPPEIMITSLNLAKKHNHNGLPFIKPWEFDQFTQKVILCAEAGVGVIACDLDSIGLITLRKMGKPAYAKDQNELAKMVREVHKQNLKFLIKGIMSVEDALACLEAGADGIVVSNHGGRVLDSTPGTAEVLPEIASVVKGRLALSVDGGIRSGVDILKMLSLGAEAVFIGRPYTIAAIGGGAEGVELLTNTYRGQLEQAMIMTGCPDVKQAGAHLLYKK